MCMCVDMGVGLLCVCMSHECVGAHAPWCVYGGQGMILGTGLAFLSCCSELSIAGYLPKASEDSFVSASHLT